MWLYVKKLNKIRREQNLSFKISLDGGVNESVKNLVKPYCDILVSGAYVCMSDNIEEKIKSLRWVSRNIFVFFEETCLNN